MWASITIGDVLAVRPWQRAARASTMITHKHSQKEENREKPQQKGNLRMHVCANYNPLLNLLALPAWTLHTTFFAALAPSLSLRVPTIESCVKHMLACTESFHRLQLYTQFTVGRVTSGIVCIGQGTRAYILYIQNVNSLEGYSMINMFAIRQQCAACVHRKIVSDFKTGQLRTNNKKTSNKEGRLIFRGKY